MAVPVHYGGRHVAQCRGKAEKQKDRFKKDHASRSMIQMANGRE